MVANPSAPVATPRLVGLPPVVSAHTRLVVLGSFPGVASLAAGQYYAHPRNQFWRILSLVWGIDLTFLGYADRLRHLNEHGLGLWDVYGACRRRGSLDVEIRDAEPNDLRQLLSLAPRLAGVAHNGGESARSMRTSSSLGVAVFRLPSSSPANASWTLERKVEAWRVALAACGLASPAVDPLLLQPSFLPPTS